MKSTLCSMAIIVLIALFPFFASSQSLSINTDGSSADGSAMLDVKSTSKGLLIPRMSRTERNAIASPATGLIIYQNAPDSVGLYYYNGTSWTWMFSNSNTDSLAWKTRGNTGTSTANNFIGTKDNVGLSFKTNNAEAMFIGANGAIGLGTNTPGTGAALYSRLDIRDELGASSDISQLVAGSGGGAPYHNFIKQRGTIAAPATIVANEVLGAVNGIAYNGSSYINLANIAFANDGNITTTKAPGLIAFNVTDTGSNTSVQRMVIKGTGNVGLSVPSPVARLDIGSTVAGNASLLLRSGNSSGGFTSNQITFGWAGSANYRHAIKTRHHAGIPNQNSIDFYLWNQGVDAPGDIGTKAVMTIDGKDKGMVGIGTTTPNSELHISDGSTSLKNVTDGGGYGASMLITDNNIPRIYLEAAAQPTNKKMMDINQSGQAIRFNSLVDDAGAYDKTDILVVHRDGKVGIGVNTPAIALDVNGSATIGTGNTNTGTKAIATGNGNNLSGNNSIASGNGNILSGNNSIVTGESNNVSAIRSMVSGVANTVQGENNLITGVLNNISGGYGHAIIVGYQNTLTGSASAVFGFGNNVNGFTTFAAGDHNTVTAQGAIAFGYQNGVNGVGGFATGSQDTIAGSNGAVFGTGNYAASYNEFSLGMFGTNYTPGNVGGYVGTDRLFNVGNGANSASRSDAFTVLKNGNVGINTSAPTALLDVNGNKIRVRNSKTPTSATDTGNTGDIAWDSNYIYVCVATNTWKRVAIATW